MLFGLKKAIGYCLMPLPFCLGLMILGILLLRSKRWPRAGRTLLATGAMLLLILSHKQVGLALVRPLENQFSPVPELIPGQPLPADLAACRTIVVLGAGQADTVGLSATGQLSSSALARLVEGVRLARLLPQATLLVSGPSAGRGPTHASVLKAAAVSLGIDPARIEMIEVARDTDDEVQEIKRRLGTAVPFALVTSAWHMPRAVGLTRKAGLHPFACPADFLAKSNPDLRASDWFFDLSGLQCSTWGIYERLGTAWARLQGKL